MIITSLKETKKKRRLVGSTREEIRGVQRMVVKKPLLRNKSKTSISILSRLPPLPLLLIKKKMAVKKKMMMHSNSSTRIKLKRKSLPFSMLLQKAPRLQQLLLLI